MLLFKNNNSGKNQIAFPVEAVNMESMNMIISSFSIQRKFVDT